VTKKVVPVSLCVFCAAGADIVETNTFSGTTIGMADYHLEEYVYELNYESAKLARSSR
jgi:5-methyltetrahydrofolate--homocysteine methyltransferase